MSTTITTAAAILLAERDGIHPAHAANRVALAAEVADVLLASTNGDDRALWTSSDTLEDLIERANASTLVGNHIRYAVTIRLRRSDLTISDATWNLATSIALALASAQA